MFRLTKNVKLIFVSLFAASALFIAGNGHASAATLTVSNSCTLSEAITSVNNALNETGCSATGTYGTDDTINVPAGTTTLSNDLPDIEKTLIISGADKSTTTIDGGGNKIFKINSESEKITKNLTVKNLRLTNADPTAIQTQFLNKVELQNLIVDHSKSAISITNNFQTIIKSVLVEDNQVSGQDTDITTGINIGIGALNEGDKPTVLVEDSLIQDNTAVGNGSVVGLGITGDDRTVDNSAAISDVDVTIRRTSILRNESGRDSGFLLLFGSGPLSTVSTALRVDASTIANNKATVVDPQVVSTGEVHVPIMSGVYLSTKLTDQQNFTNVTIANNSATLPETDNRNAIVGFFGAINPDGSNLRITNTTVVGNSLTQPDLLTFFSTFSVLKVEIDISGYPTIAISSVVNGSSAENVLLANNKINGQKRNCYNSLDLSVLGAGGTLDSTPVDLGHNMSDDNSCTGYTYEKDLYDTIEHEVADNGGPVPTIKLLEGSPAINAGGQVLGISTDARGVERDGFYSIGAYQGELLAASTDKKLANTGVIFISSIVLGGLILIVLAYTYVDYRRHKRPLVQADPYARQTYTYGHHIKTVTFPLMRYRLNISVSRSPKGVTKF